MNMSNVKVMSSEVVVNNVRYRKGVKQIKDSNNNILWSSIPGWTTIWEGNKTFTSYGNSNYAEEYICRSIFENNVSSTQYRLTFSFNYNKPAGADLLYVNTNDPDLWSTTPTPSPFTITIPANKTLATKLLALSIDGTSMPAVRIIIDQTGSGFNDGVNGIWFVGTGGGTSGQAIYFTSITLTKIEQYISYGSLYRRLEYIHFNGAERIETPFYAGTSGVNYQSEFTIDKMPTGSAAPVYIGINDQTINNNLARLYLPQVNSTGIHINIGNAWSSYSSSTPIDTKLKFSASFSKTSGGNPRVYFYLYNQDTGTTILTTDPLQAGASGNLNIDKVMSIGASRYVTSSSDTLVSYWKGKCYNFQQRSGGASGTLLYNLLPCQRRSDNVCGLYDTVNSVFLPMTGTTITNAAAGPVVDEYWNLQA